MKLIEAIVGNNNALLKGYCPANSSELSNIKNRPTALIFPGGGYRFVSDREAEPVALAYVSEGFNAFVLYYTANEKSSFAEAFSDANEALDFLYSQSDSLNIDPTKIVIVGFSAGGHLALSLGTLRQLKPAALVLGYPVVREDMGPLMSIKLPNLLESVRADTPPSFVFSTQDDDIVPVVNTIDLIKRLSEEGIPFENHIYLTGGHGLSLAKTVTCNGNVNLVNTEVSEWFGRSIKFLNNIWGDFSSNGEVKRIRSSMEKKEFGIHMSVKNILENQIYRNIVLDLLPQIEDIVKRDPLLINVSLLNIIEYNEHEFTKGKNEIIKLINEHKKCTD